MFELIKKTLSAGIGDALLKEEKIETTKQIPILGKIPVVGMAFRNHDETDSKTEIVIFLTPRIISGDISLNIPI